MDITKEDWQQAFYKAEQDTVEEFPDERLCETKNKDGEYDCALCYLSIKMKEELGLE